MCEPTLAFCYWKLQTNDYACCQWTFFSLYTTIMHVVKRKKQACPLGRQTEAHIQCSLWARAVPLSDRSLYVCLHLSPRFIFNCFCCIDSPHSALFGSLFIWSSMSFLTQYIRISLWTGFPSPVHDETGVHGLWLNVCTSIRQSIIMIHQLKWEPLFSLRKPSHTITSSYFWSLPAVKELTFTLKLLLSFQSSSHVEWGNVPFVPINISPPCSWPPLATRG